MITIKEVANKYDFKDFTNFPYQLYKNCQYYIPNFVDDNYLFDENRNSSYDYCECRLFLCVDGDKVLGRIATIINHRYNEEHDTKEIRFFKYSAIDSLEVTTLLMNQVKMVAKENDLTSIVGDMGFTQFNHYGVLADGFDSFSVYDAKYNYPYYVDHLKRLNFKEDSSWSCYKINVPKTLDNRMDSIRDVILKKYNLKFQSITTIKKNDNLADIISKSMALRMKNYDYFYSFNTISEEEIQILVNRFKTIIEFTNINTCYYFVVTDKNDDVVGFALGIPSLATFLGRQNMIISPSISSLYKKASSKAESIDLISIVVNKEYQNRGISLILKNELFKACVNNNIKYINTDFDFDLSKTIKEEFDDCEVKKVKTFTSFRLDI